MSVERQHPSRETLQAVRATWGQTVAPSASPTATVAAAERLAEAVAAGELEHPNILPVCDVVRNADGDLFSPTRQVRGKSWAAVLRETPLDENIHILLSVCDAVAYAHDKGILHRDLKPENVMLGEYGEILLMGWGLSMSEGASAAEGAPAAAAGLAGTPAYMAPEMANGDVGKTGKASEVYLLGGILYEIVTGLRPHAGEDVYECLSAAMENIVQPTGRQGELVEIALKAMATRTEDRYPSVKAFQRAIRDFLAHAGSFKLSATAGERLAALDDVPDEDVYREAHEIVAGCQQALKLWEGNRSAAEGLFRAREELVRIAGARGDLSLADSEVSALQIECRAHGLDSDHEKAAEALARRVRRAMAAARVRQRLVRIGTGLAVLAGAVALAMASRACHLAGLERDRALQARQEALQERDRAQVAKEREAGLRQQAQESVTKTDAAYRKLDLENYFNLIALAQRRIEEAKLAQAKVLLWSTPAAMRDWEWGWLLLLCHRELQTLTGHSSGLLSCAFAPDGTNMLTVAADNALIVWDGKSGRPLLTVTAGEPLLAGAFSRDGRSLVALTRGGRVRRWSAADGRESPGQPLLNGLHNGPPLGISADGRWVVGGAEDGRIRLWDVGTGAELAATGVTDEGAAEAVAVSSDRGRLAALTGDGRIQVWEAAGAVFRPALRLGAGGPVTCIALSADGQRLLAGGADATARVWDTKTGKTLLHLMGQMDTVSCAAFSADGRRLLTGSNDRAARLWDALVSEELVNVKAHASAVTSLTFRRDGSELLTAGDDGFVRTWRVRNGEALPALSAGIAALAAAVSPDGSRVFAALRDGKVGAWDAATGRFLAMWGELRQPVSGLALAPDGSCLAAATREGVTLWDTAAGKRTTTLPGEGRVDQAVAFSPDGRLLAVAGQGVALWDVVACKKRMMLDTGERGAVSAVAFSPDGTRVVMGGLWGVRMCLATNADDAMPLAGASDPVSRVAFLPGGRRFVTAGRGIVGIWDAKYGRELVSLKPSPGWVTAVAVTPDGRYVAAASDDGSVRVWGGFDPAMEESDLPEQKRQLPGM